MIFKPVLINKILLGAKTVTRRPVVWHEPHPDYPPTPPWKLGQVVAAQPGMARPAVARLRITDVREQALGAIGPDDARREGFPDVEEFKAYWKDLYKGQFEASMRVWRIAFEVVDVMAFPCGSCDGHGYEEVPEEAREHFVEGCRVDAEALA